MAAFDHFAYPLAIDRGLGTIAEQDDYSAYIRALVIQTIMTAQGERINRPEFGASIRRLVFSPLNVGVERFVQTIVLQALNRWLSRYIRTTEVRVRVAEETLLVEIDYVLLAEGEEQFLSMEVTA
ncbi:MAG: GPW/gp25 family protein [Alphaproteobacteria bacterium]|nr:GPW/gp25 family protein [Alphaproteobacteria bacterium]MBV9373195.1 GPW/gp25 family protein [Alphaproteobacteria bacterium]MBV9900284.1 GPW/gp25 family protein [Alphaproteobacteria bacterium]